MWESKISVSKFPCLFTPWFYIWQIDRTNTSKMDFTCYDWYSDQAWLTHRFNKDEDGGAGFFQHIFTTMFAKSASGETHANLGIAGDPTTSISHGGYKPRACFTPWEFVWKKQAKFVRCVCSVSSVPGGGVIITWYQSLNLSPQRNPPHMCHPVVLPPPDSLSSFQKGSSNRFHIVWTPWLAITSQPGPCPFKSSPTHRQLRLSGKS